MPAIFESGSPSTRWKRPENVGAIERSGLRALVYDRPGYGGSTRAPGRTVADAVHDVRALADARGWRRFAISGGSGGGPFALACAALLPERVTRCAVVSGIMPPDVSDLERPGLRKGSRLAALGEAALRPYLEETGRDLMAGIEAGGPEFPPDPHAPKDAPVPGPALEDPAAMARLRATFVESHDGWVDDDLAFVRPWGFEMESIRVPVGIWYGKQDANVSNTQSEWLLKHIPGAQDHGHGGGHVPNVALSGRIYTWMRG
jgi:pimeloyl-ACP methyl ester carboxylesterase